MLRPEAVLQAGGEALRAASCLRGHSKLPRRDAYGRPAFAGSKGRPCCEGNIFTVVGSSPASGTVADCAAAMGLDFGHMTYAEMAQAVPPDYASFAFGQAVEHELRSDFGLVAVPTYDEVLADPAAAKRVLQHLLRGSGGVAADQGVAFVLRVTPLAVGGGGLGNPGVAASLQMRFDDAELQARADLLEKKLESVVVAMATTHLEKWRLTSGCKRWRRLTTTPLHPRPSLPHSCRLQRIIW